MRNLLFFLVLPYNFLLDSNGVIVRVNVGINELDEILNEI